MFGQRLKTLAFSMLPKVLPALLPVSDPELCEIILGLKSQGGE